MAPPPAFDPVNRPKRVVYEPGFGSANPTALSTVSRCLTEEAAAKTKLTAKRISAPTEQARALQRVLTNERDNGC